MLHSAALSSTPMRRVGLPTAMRPFLVVRGRGVRAPPARFFVDQSTVSAPAARPGNYVASGLAATPSRREQHSAAAPTMRDSLSERTNTNRDRHATRGETPAAPLMSGRLTGRELSLAQADRCRSYVKQGMGVGALAVIVGGV